MLQMLRKQQSVIGTYNEQRDLVHLEDQENLQQRQLRRFASMPVVLAVWTQDTTSAFVD